MEKVKIAIVQQRIKIHQPEINLNLMEQFIKKAAGKADIIVFPEDSVTGPVMRKKEFVDYNHKYAKHFQILAKKYLIDIVPGSIIEADKRGWFNVAYYIDKSGKILGRYEKINLWHPERSYLKSGTKPCVFKTRFGKTALLICWDLAFPETFKQLLLKNAEIIICPSYWLKGDAGVGTKYTRNSEEMLVDSMCASRAFENESIMVYTNGAGKFNYGKYSDALIGHTQICAPFLGSIAKMNHNKQDMRIIAVDLSILKDAEKAYKLRVDAKKRAQSFYSKRY